MISVEQITSNYGKRQILKNINLEGQPGECIGIVGSNGCGKSTLLSILSGVAKPDSGNLIYFQKEPLKNRRLFQKLCGYVPQDNPLIEELSVKDNLKLWCGRNIREDELLLKQFQMEELLHTTVNKLSGGMKRRITVLCAMMELQPILIMDEPTTALDIFHKTNIHQYMNDHLKRNGIIIIATHDMEEIQMCNKLYYMENGVLEKIEGREEALHRIRENSIKVRY